jgi:predicted permease
MARFDGIRRLLHIQRGGAGIERAVNDELQFHFDMTMRELMASGMNPDEARKEAERRFGDVQRTRERLTTIDRARVGREQRAEWWSGFTQDLRYAIRGLRLKPGFALAVIVTLGLGIGANATMFGIVDRLLFRPPNMLITPNRAGKIFVPRTNRGKENVNSFMGYRIFLDLRENTQSFDAMTPYYINKLAVGTGENTSQMNIAVGTSDLWRMFDAKPAIGRFFSAEDDEPTHPTNVMVASFGFWQTRFGGRKDILGSQIDVGPKRYTIIGVTPEGFNGFTTDPVAGFLPIASAAENSTGDPKNPWYSTYNMRWFESYARRKPGVSIAAADADLTRAHQLSYKKQVAAQPRATPFNLAKPRGFIAPVLTARGPNPQNESRVATWLGGVALIVLVIAIANVANLLLARALKRRREIAVRIALGVSRGRLLAQLLTESVLLAILGGAVGLVIAQWGGAVLRRSLLSQEATFSAFTDVRMLGFIALLAVAAGFLTGLAPAFQAGRADIAGTLKAGAREGNVHRSKLRIGLLLAQAALSVVLLVGAGLFVRSLWDVKNLRLGYDADRLLIVDLSMRGMKVDSNEAIALRNRMVEKAKTLPGVENAARALTVPFWSTWQLSLFVPGIDSVNKLGNFSVQAGTPDLFKTMGTRITRGRGLTEEDRAGSPYVVVVTESMAKKLWPNQDPIGKTMRINSDTNPVRTVVGVAEDQRRGSLSEAEDHYYIPITQFRFNEDILFVRTADAAAGHSDAVRRSLQQLMPGTSFVAVTPLTQIMESTTRSWKLGATMFTIFGILALVLAAIGLYSVIAYNVTQRTHEMGVRVALGAQARDVIRLIVKEGLWIAVPGVVLGAIIALVASKWVRPLLFNVQPKDPTVIGIVILTLITVAIAASWAPATRAARVDPNEALRAD